MSFSVSANNIINKIFNKSETTAQTPTAPIQSTTIPMAGDSVNISYSNQAPLPEKATTFKQIGNSIGQAFGNIADKLGFGETRKLINQEFSQIDQTRDGNLNKGEFNVATLNLFDFSGAEFAKADSNRDGLVNQKEYANYRKEQLSDAFDKKETSGDNHLNSNEIGFIGKQLLVNKDVRLDENQDGLVNKREFTNSVVRGTMNVRDFLGL